MVMGAEQACVMAVVARRLVALKKSLMAYVKKMITLVYCLVVFVVDGEKKKIKN